MMFSLKSTILNILFNLISYIKSFFLITRPKLPYGRQGVAGSFGKDTVRRVHFGVFSTSHFALSSGGSQLAVGGEAGQE